MQQTLKDGVHRALRYVYPPNRLRLCGPEKSHDEYVLLLRDVEKAIEFLNTLPNVSKYCSLIAKHNGLETYYPDVITAYFLGSLTAFIEGVSHTHLALKLSMEGMMLRKVERVAEFRKTLVDKLNSCAVRYGHIISNSKENILVRMIRFQMENGKLISQLKDEPLIKLPFERENYVKGDIVAVHWGYIIERIERETYEMMSESIIRDITNFNSSSIR